MSLLLQSPLARVRRIVAGPLGLPSPLAGRTVLVTGASSGIGEATAYAVARTGATVLLVARRADELERVRQAIEESGGQAAAYVCDLTDGDAVDALVEEVLAEHGVVDYLVNNAGRSIRRSLSLSEERFHDFERPMRLNYFAAIRLTTALLPGMCERESGQIVNLSTWAAQVHPARFSGYTASKAALEAWSDCVQGEVLDDGVVFTTIRMPLVRTPMIEPTRVYRSLPALSADQAAAVVCDAIVRRPRRLSPVGSGMVALAEAVSPRAGDLIRKNVV